MLAEIAAEEDELFLVAESKWAELLGHAPLGDHPARQLGGLANIVRGSRGDVAEDQLFRDPSAQDDGHIVVQLAARHQVTILRRQLHRPAEGHAARDDRDLVHRVGVGQRLRHQRVADLVVGDHVLFLLGDHPRLAFRAGDDTGDRFLKLELADGLLVVARGENRSLINKVAQVGTAEPRGLAGEDLEIDLAVERLVARVHLEDRAAAANVGTVQRDVPVEAAGTEERRIEHVRPVGGGDHDHMGVGLEAVHLDQQLVEGLLALVVAPAQPGASLAADGVDLVDEDDAGGVLLGLVEEVTDTGGAHTDEHLDELGAGDAEEGHAGLAGDRLGEQGLARTRRADHEHPFRDSGAQGRELFRELEELDDFGELLLGLLHAGDVVEGDGRLVAAQQSSATATEGDRLVIATLALAQHVPHEAADHQEQDDVRQDDRQQQIR